MNVNELTDMPVRETKIAGIPLTVRLYADDWTWNDVWLSLIHILVWLFLPSMQKELPLATGTVEAPRRNRRDTLLLFVICTLMWG